MSVPTIRSTARAQMQKKQRRTYQAVVILAAGLGIVGLGFLLQQKAKK